MRSRVVEPGDEDDKALLERHRLGDPQAFASLVGRYQKPIYNAAFRVLGRAQDANDVAQEVFLRIFDRLDDYDPKHKFFSWIYRIAVNESIDMLRRTNREEPLEDDADFEAADSSDPQWHYEARQAAARVQRALMGMKVDDRVVITLRHFAECGYADMAMILAIDEKTVKSRLFEARRRLAAQLADLRGVYS
jgi:RNA polymerase sigma-70 factor (ECF subfamily)